METDASNQATGGIASQYHIVKGAKELHFVGYHAKTLTATQGNWPIYNKELFTIIDCFWKLQDCLVGIHMNIYTDH